MNVVFSEGKAEMPEDFAPLLAALRPAFDTVAPSLRVSRDTPLLYSLVTQKPSPFPQHKGHPLDFGSLRAGKAYVSLHLMPVYMSPTLAALIPPGLRKRMQGKSCFNFKTAPDPETLAALKTLIEAAFREWTELGWT